MNKIWLSDKYVYPGPQPVSIERKHFSTLKANDYLIGHKNDGERIALCIIRYMDKPRCYLLNRKLEITPISLLVTKKMYDGTIFDCELVNENEIYIFDCPCFAGESLKHRQFTERLDFGNAFLSGYKHRAQDSYNFYVKQFADRQDYSSLPKCLKTDGYVLVPNKKNVQTGTHNSYFKWKPQMQNTIDFAINKQKQVFLQNAGKFCKTSVSLLFDSFETIFKNDSDYIIIECVYQDENIWKPLQIRGDKNIPNSLFTYKRTLVNIQENIQFDELVS